MVVALWATIQILSQFTDMDELTATATFHPPAKAIFFCRLYFNFWFTAGGKTQQLIKPLSKKSRFGLRQTLFNRFPIKNIPYCLDIIRPNILILKVISMLPHIYSQ